MSTAVEVDETLRSRKMLTRCKNPVMNVLDLKMFLNFYTKFDLIPSSQIADKANPKERMVQVVKWYMSAYHAGRKSSVAKKPYNPILGEVFQCHWDIPGFTETSKDKKPVTNGPVPWCSRGQLAFVAEQVSHHPPISAFYAECVAKKICFEAFVYTKSKFLGLSVGVHNIGHGTVHVLEYKEDYVVTFPSGYGRSILTTPWIELGGTVSISCKKTGYNATIEFHTKPFYGGKKHRITGEIFAPMEKKPFMTISGEWNGVMEAKVCDTGKSEVFVDVLKTPVTKKSVKSVVEQRENESRNLWKEVTAGLRLNDIDKATLAKTLLEQKQRDEAKKRKERGVQWETKLFYEKSEGDWFYRYPLFERIDDLDYTKVEEE